ncbi:MAG: phage tail tip lysozyme [Candidatus Saccharimonadales bacterium]
MKKRILSLLFISLLIFSVLLSLPVRTFAMTKGERNSISKNLPFYNPAAENCDPLSIAKTDGGSGTGKIYMLGDSITEGTTAELTTTLSAKGFSEVVIDGKSSRRLSEGNSDLDGIGVLKNSVDKFKDAGTIVIALGTNGTINNANIDKTMEIIKADSPSAKVYWVNIGVNNAVRSGGPIDNASLNTILQENTTKGYAVVDWSSQVDQHPDYIDPNPSSGLGVHPAGAGKQAFADTVANGATGAAAPAAQTPSGGGASCCAAHSATSDSVAVGDGSTEANAKTIFQYFVGKGLTDFQAAGILGNIENESGFNPRRVEGTATPSGDSDTPDSRGYGIVQFTPGTKIVPAAQAAGKLPSDIVFQLDFIWEQFQGPESAAFKAIQETTTLPAATVAFELKYERHAGGAQPKRIESAQKWFDKFQGTGGSSFASGGCSSKVAATGSDFAGYFQTDPEWKNIPYASGTVGSSGCGATSLATVIGNLTADKSVTPATIVQEIRDSGLLPTTVSLNAFSVIPKNHGLTMQNYTVGQFTEALDRVKNSNGSALMIANVSPGYWTTVGHYFVIRGVADDGKVQVHDVGESTASHPKTDKTYDPSFFTGGETNAINFMVISK